MSTTLSSLPPTTADSPLPSPILTTPRLLIRPMHPQDAETMQHAASPPSITKYMTLVFAHPYTLEHARTWINLNLTHPSNNWVITPLTDPGTVIGGIGFKPGSDVQSHTAEIGYWIGEEWQGKGLMVEAVVAVTDWEFVERGDVVRKVWAGVCGGNDGSMRVLEKAGYVKEGVLKGHVEKHGEVRDMHMFGLRKEDWEEKRKGR
ncbi:acyl-CoA N-acyltransferase [Polyplosphaeria fusca]|uniref:Acyl-CoA N-acyltransferase n=1 Tax=Polyplosphaeria fusca TaxID=682080 RepID=A0A9P4UWZ7_9PLEO|nr:acyl-CoA N-acyltransferase [Polyplosphaeria fusca]